jgi:hypothetical protein
VIMRMAPMAMVNLLPYLSLHHAAGIIDGIL